MNIFDTHFDSMKKNELLFNKYCQNRILGIQISQDKEKNYYKKGKQLLTNNTIEYFLEVRAVYYHNIVNNELRHFNFPEWMVCLEENVLLEYALPIFSRVLKEYPMLGGLNGEWEVMYIISQISEEFWKKHRDWQRFFVDILECCCTTVEEDNLIGVFPKDYLFQIQQFRSSLKNLGINE